jgi:hypothetical protein
MAMIWFACKGCGKTHGRPDASSGTMVFCACGQGNVVPWESTAAEPAALPAAEAPQVPTLAPLTFEPDPRPAGESRPAPPPGPAPTRPPIPARFEDDEAQPRRRRTEKRDPAFCFNHQRTPKTGSCADCEESFCPDCLVPLQGAALCGPCKNFRARRMELAPTNSPLATGSLMLSLLTGPLAVCLMGGSWAFGVVALLPQTVALGLGLWALRAAEKEGRPAGPSLAVTGVATAAVTGILIVLLNIYAARYSP